MSKEYLEALERLAMPDELHIKECKRLGIGLTKDYDILKQYFESIDNSNPSEALECLRQIGIIEMYSHEGTLLKDSISFKPEYDTIKNYILKAQEQKMVLKILFEKNVNIFQLRMLCETLDEYNARPKEERLTEKEFNLLKEMINNEL